MTLEELLKKHDIPDDCLSCSYLPPGWESLVDALFTKMIDADWNRDLLQVKQKFGGLRVYIGEWSREIAELIADAEELSFSTCELCGSFGRATRRSGCLRTVCMRCNLDAPDNGKLMT